MSPLALNTLAHALWLWGLAQTAPVSWECEDAFSSCKETCSVNYGMEGIAGARLNGCLSECLTTVKGCRERARREAAYAPTEPAEPKPWEKTSEPEYKAPEPECKTLEPVPKEEAPPRKSPSSKRKPPAQKPGKPPMPQETPAPAALEQATMPIPTPPSSPPYSPPSEDGGKPPAIPPPPSEDDWKPWTPPPSEKKPRERERPIDEWNPR